MWWRRSEHRSGWEREGCGKGALPRLVCDVDWSVLLEMGKLDGSNEGYQSVRSEVAQT